MHQLLANVLTCCVPSVLRNGKPDKSYFDLSTSAGPYGSVAPVVIFRGCDRLNFNRFNLLQLGGGPRQLIRRTPCGTGSGTCQAPAPGILLTRPCQAAPPLPYRVPFTRPNKLSNKGLRTSET